MITTIELESTDEIYWYLLPLNARFRNKKAGGFIIQAL